ncbi:MAG: Ppx/GppA phosphatase family protein [Verrucomicrobiia bacterium]|jgi:exopolyphosphatase/guanosine-5'-triphosphate,3'-diphosphate pyrophosphatase
MRRAVIDIGTNTVKLLVADVSDRQCVPAVAKDRTTRLGEGVEESRRLLPVAMDRTVRAIQDFLAEARALGATDCVAVATSAARDAANRDEFLGQVRHACGLDVELISGEREAELIFRGVSSDPEWSGAPILVVDVGGGSAEFIQGRDGKMEVFQSLPLGALRLTEKFGEGRCAKLCEYLRAMLTPALAGYHAGGYRMIATGGTMVTLARVECGTVDHATISREKLKALVRRLEVMPLAERKKVPGLPPERADIIVAGGAVLLVAMEILGASELAVSVRNLRYGVVVSD